MILCESDVNISLNLKLQKDVPAAPASAELKCAAHSNKDSVLVCIDCAAGLCINCMKTVSRSAGPHKDHQLEELTEAETLLRQKYNSQVKEVCVYC